MITLPNLGIPTASAVRTRSSFPEERQRLSVQGGNWPPWTVGDSMGGKALQWAGGILHPSTRNQLLLFWFISICT